MSSMIARMAAEAERPREPEFQGPLGRKPPRRAESAREGTTDLRNLPAHQFPAKNAAEVESAGHGTLDEGERQKPHPVPAKGTGTKMGHPEEVPLAAVQELEAEESECDPQLRVYRGRTITMLRRYMRYSIETGRLPSLLGREFFRAKVTSYTVVTFEDRVIFVHDMETCLERLDEFSRQIIARHILQEHDQVATGRLLHCTERTVRTYIPVALDLMSEILLEAGLLER